MQPEPPGPATLVFPHKNSLCNQGSDKTASESNILFEWQAGENTSTYELKIEDLFEGTTFTHSTGSLQISLTLKRGTPYAWHVISLSDVSDETAKSETWKFYISGDAKHSHAPFPAEIISPAMASSVLAESGLINLEWSGYDVDGDIIGFDIYMGITDDPPLLESLFTESVYSDFPVISNSVYYWKIITKDSRGNSSDSGVYQFKVN